MTDDDINQILIKTYTNNYSSINTYRKWRDISSNLILSFKDLDLDISGYTYNSNIFKLKKLEYDNIFNSNLLCGHCEVISNATHKIISDIYLIEIDCFYPTIIKQLIESDILDTDKDFNKIFLIIYYFIENNKRTKLSHSFEKSTSVYSEDLKKFYRTWINYAFVILSSTTTANTHLSRFGNTINIARYTRDVFEKIMNELNWIYVDIDSIYCYNKDKYEINKIFNKHGISCSIEHIQYMYIKSEKKYLYIKEIGGIFYRGIKPHTEEEVVDELNIRRRNDIISNILEN